jgi:hypothetical protein
MIVLEMDDAHGDGLFGNGKHMERTMLTEWELRKRRRGEEGMRVKIRKRNKSYYQGRAQFFMRWPPATVSVRQTL